MSEMDPMMMQMLMAQLLQGDGNAGLQQELAGYDAMGPELYGEMVGLDTMGQRGQLARQGATDEAALLQHQMALVEALQKPKPLNHSTVGGQVGEGIGNILGGVFGGIRSNQLAGQQREALAGGTAAQTGLLDKQDDVASRTGQARYGGMRNYLAEALMQRQPQQPAMSPRQGMGFGLTGLQLDPSLFGG